MLGEGTRPYCIIYSMEKRLKVLELLSERLGGGVQYLVESEEEKLQIRLKK